MSKYLTAILVFSLILGGSCKKGEKGKPAEPKPVSTKPIQPQIITPFGKIEPKILEPKNYYQFKLENFKIAVEYDGQILQLLKESKKKSEELLKRLRELNEDKLKKINEINVKYGVGLLDEKETLENPSSKKSLETYLQAHPEVKQEIEAMETKLSELNQGINQEMDRLGMLPKGGEESEEVLPRVQDIPPSSENNCEQCKER